MFSIVKNWKIFFAITVSFLVIGVGSILFKGFNLGIDFTGGSIMDLSFNKAVTVAEVRDVLKEHNLGNSVIQLENVDGEQSSKNVLIRTGVINDSLRREVMADLGKDLGEFQIQRVEQVGMGSPEPVH